MQQVRFSSSQLSCLDFQQKLQEAHFVQDKQCFGGEATFRNAFFRQVICLSDGGTSFLATRLVARVKLR
jgi:transposase